MSDKGIVKLIGRAGSLLLVALVCVPALTASGQQPQGLPGSPSVPALVRTPDGKIVPAGPDSGATSQPPQQPPSPPVAQRPAAAAPHPSGLRSTSDMPRGIGTRPKCAEGAITCAEVLGQSHAVDSMPVTFGQPFRQGDVPRGAHLTAVDQKGNAIPLQLDAKNSYADGSLRFAVISALLPHMDSRESRTISLRLASPGAVDTILSAPGDSPRSDISVTLQVYSRQITIVKFGNRVGNDPGTPFKAGETVTVKAGDEEFSLVVAPDMAAGTGIAYSNIAKAFVPLINGRSRKFRAFRIEQGDGFEKLRITTTEALEPFTVSYVYAGGGKIAVSNYVNYERPVTWTATLRPDATGKTWLNGPVAREQDFILPLISQAGGATHPNLTARIHLRRYPNAAAWRADVIVENGWAYQPGDRNYTYDATISVNGEDVQRFKEIPHYHNARWHKVIWSPGFEEPVVALNVPYFVDTPMVLHYDTRLTIPDQTISRDFESMKAADTRPMGSAEVLLYMPTTGGRADIGPLPRWATIYLLSMDPRAKAIMLANADAGAGIPIHYREKKTDFPISLDEHPTVAMGPGLSNPHDSFPPIEISDTPWTPQIAHHPSLFYLPYLVTGDLFFFEEQLFWGTWVMASASPAYRGDAKALVNPNEVRGQAWSLRTMTETLAALPDGHPLKPYFAEKIDNNLQWYVAHYIHNPDLQRTPFQAIIPKTDDMEIVVPWQQDYMITSLGFMAGLGYAQAADLARWLMRFAVGIWTSDAAGFCHQMAAPYTLKIQDAPNHYVTTWKEDFQLNWPTAQGCPSNFVAGDPTAAGGYVANAYAMLSIATDLGYPGASEALSRLRSEAPQLQNAFADNPTFAIVPRTGVKP